MSWKFKLNFIDISSCDTFSVEKSHFCEIRDENGFLQTAQAQQIWHRCQLWKETNSDDIHLVARPTLFQMLMFRESLWNLVSAENVPKKFVFFFEFLISFFADSDHEWKHPIALIKNVALLEAFLMKMKWCIKWKMFDGLFFFIFWMRNEMMTHTRRTSYATAKIIYYDFDMTECVCRQDNLLLIHRIKIWIIRRIHSVRKYKQKQPENSERSHCNAYRNGKIKIPSGHKIWNGDY